MRWIFVLSAALLLAACSPAQNLISQTFISGVGYDTEKDPKVPGRYHARASLDPKRAGDPGDVGMQALLNGLQAAQKDGYEFATYAGPRGGTVTRTLTSGSTSAVTHQYPAIIFDVQGYKSTDGRPPNARPIAAVVASVTADMEKRKAARAAVQSMK